MPALKDLSGQRFVRLLVIKRIYPNCNNGEVRWECACDCGEVVVVRGHSLTSGNTKSCGCLQIELARERFKISNNPPGKKHPRFKHGYCSGGDKTVEYRMWERAKHRAGAADVPFDIEPCDIIIPELCPILGIKMEACKSKMGAFSPSLDRIIPELGYIKGNIAVISYRANTIKNNATPEELRRVADWLEGQIGTYN